jgi:multiple sugar transport system permease protein
MEKLTVRQPGGRKLFTRSVLGLLAIIMLVPVAVTILYSFCSPDEIDAFMKTRGNYDTAVWMELKLSPKVFSLSQYYEILVLDMSILRMFVNSAVYAVLILLGQAVVIPMMAYALSRFRFRGREAIFFGIIMLMLLPFQVTMVPNVLTLRTIGLLNTVWAVIIPMWFSPFYIFLIRQFMLGLPNELLEAAQMDGAGTLRCYSYVVIPVCRPVIGAAIALSFADCWNLVEQPMTYLSQRADLYPLSVEFNRLAGSNAKIVFAGAALYILPALFIYLYFLNDILSGVQLTELK